jgi:hypothetical protein
VGKPLLEVLRDTAVDPVEQATLTRIGATRYLAQHGYGDVDAEDLREAVGLVADTLPADIAQTLAFEYAELIDPTPGPPGDAQAGGLGIDVEAPGGPGDEGAFGAGSVSPEPALAFGTGAGTAEGAEHHTVDHGLEAAPTDPHGGSVDIPEGAGRAVDAPSVEEDVDPILEGESDLGEAGDTGDIALHDAAGADDIGAF